MPVELVMPCGAWTCSPDASIRLTLKNNTSLAHLAAGEVGVLGEDYVEGKLDIDGSMRDLMYLAAAILPGSPVDAARNGCLTGLTRRVFSVWSHSVGRYARQIQFPYVLSADFYPFCLDPIGTTFFRNTLYHSVYT